MPISVSIERGSKRTFACATEWPGWCRSGKDEAAALAALFDYAPRYARALARKKIRSPAPKSIGDLKVVERHKGTATTDFGAPAASLTMDVRPFRPRDLKRLEAIYDACRGAFDAIASSAGTRALRKGPRGGGRDLDAIVAHVLEADAGYIGAMGGKAPAALGASTRVRSRAIRDAFVETLAASAGGEIPARGPRGGIRWKPRFAIRRSAWHWLDHAWEIEDRSA